MASYAKVKSVGKDVLTKGELLEKKKLDTMRTVAQIVGSTLGPGGHPVLIERQETNMPNMVTKDGVTVFKSLGFLDPVKHAIMESARDASVRTANEAGDGTTTATILAEAIVRYTHEFALANPKVGPQKVIAKLEKTFRDFIEPEIRKLSRKADFSTVEGRTVLHSVARISANGDIPLADKVLECFDLVGDQGNVTITEISGPSAYEVERIDGFPVAMGYEDSCAKFYAKFINDPGNQRVNLENPVFVLFHGRVTEIQSVIFLMETIGAAWQNEGYNHNVVLVATGFSESVLAQLAMNFAEPTTINVFPLLAPMDALKNSQLEFLNDLAAITGASIYDPLNKPLPRSHEEVDLKDLGYGVRTFEAQRFRSTVIGQCDEVLVLDRVDTLQKMRAQAGSILEATFLDERIGKITGGIARLKVIGASNGELREKRDRAEDAVMAVRGAIKHGVLPGGGWTLLHLATQIAKQKDEILSAVLVPALLAPVKTLLSNAGYNAAEQSEIVKPILDFIDPRWVDWGVLPGPSIWQRVKAWWDAPNWADGLEAFFEREKKYLHEYTLTFDVAEGKHVDAYAAGVVDSTPAVLEAIRNSISIAGLLGSLGGTVVYFRDLQLERTEAKETNEFLRNADWNPADERG